MNNLFDDLFLLNFVSVIQLEWKMTQWYILYMNHESNTIDKSMDIGMIILSFKMEIETSIYQRWYKLGEILYPTHL